MTVKHILIVGGVVVGLYVAVRALRASAARQPVLAAVLNPSLPIIPPERRQARFGAGHFV